MDIVIKESLIVNETDEDSGSSHDSTVAKAVSMCILFVCSFALGTIPIKLAKWFEWKSDTKNNIYVQMLLCMGGGVLLCTTFIHLLPEVQEGIENSEILSSVDIKLAETLMCIGFFLMYFVEECVHVYLHMRETNNELAALRRSLSIRRGENEFPTKEDALRDLEEGHHNPAKEQKHHDHNHNNNHDHKGHSHIIIEEDTVLSTLRGLLIVLALAIHEIFEGLAIGLESSANQVWYMFGAVSAHKLVIAFCIGVELVTSNMRSALVIVYIFVFAIVSPIGIAIGIGLSEAGTSNADVPSVILQGLATGTLLYVVFFEVLQADRKSGLKQYFSVLGGFVVMFGMTLIGSD